MATKLLSSDTLATLLREEGFPIPDNVREVRLVAHAGSRLIIQYDVMLIDSDVIRLGKALQRLGEGTTGQRLSED